MQQKQGFSFGYKNLIDKIAANPGPNHYYFNESSMNTSIGFVRQLTKRAKVRQQINFLKPITEEHSSKKIAQRSTFAKSERKEICLLIPQLSKGPQQYNTSMPIGTPSKAIDLAKYSERVFDYQTPVPGVGTYDPQEVRYHKDKQTIYQAQVDPFRKLSYLYQTTEPGPCQYDPKQNTEVEAYQFAKADRLPNNAIDSPCVGGYDIQDSLEYSRTPIFSFSKHMPENLSSYQKRKQFLNSTPSGSNYESTSSFKNAVCTARSTKFTTSSRHLTPLTTDSGPGPGSYDPYQLRPQQQQQSTRSIQMIYARKLNRHLNQDPHVVSMKNINKTCPAGQYDMSQKIVGDKHQFTEHERSDEFLSPLGQNQVNSQRSPQKSSSQKGQSQVTKQQASLFPIAESRPNTGDMSSIFQKKTTRVMKRHGKHAHHFTFDEEQ